MRRLLRYGEKLVIAKPSVVDVIPLIFSSSKSVGETNLQEVARNPNDTANLKQLPGDLPDPLLMAVALENTRSKARLSAIGDADWVYK